jgi:hypothetical protein
LNSGSFKLPIYLAGVRRVEEIEQEEVEHQIKGSKNSIYQVNS